jgi:hypothetical protein
VTQSKKLRTLFVSLAALGAAIAPAGAQTPAPPAPPARAAAAPTDPAANAAAKAATLKPVVQAGYVVPRLKDGHPDLSGVWTNATLTRLERSPRDGMKLILSDEEMAATEKDTQTRNARQNAPTPQAVRDNWTKTATAGPDTADECRSGSRGAACGYNAGWTDPGDWVMRVAGKGRTSFITYPVNGRMPARKAAAAARPVRVETSEESGGGRGQADNPEDRSLGERCIMSFGVSSGPVMTGQLYNNTYQFVQTKDNFVMWVEMVHDARIVKMNAKHRTDGIRPWMGDQIGWWDGDTLVVETVGYNPKQTNLRGGGPNIKVTERFTRVAADRLHYAFDVQDPDTWAEPWGGEYEFAAVKGNVYEYACHEGNYGLSGILSGAREDDVKAEAAKKVAVKGKGAATKQ